MKKSQGVYLELAGIVGAALLAILIGFIAILFISEEPMAAISSFLYGPISSTFNLGTLINKAVPLIFTGLAIAVVFQANVFSLGAEGQLYVGGFAGALIAVYWTGASPWIVIPVAIVVAMLGGALFGYIPGVLKAKLNANEIVTTLMLNFVAIIGTAYFVNNVFKDPLSGGYARMRYIDKSSLLAKFSQGFPAHTGIFIALGTVVVVYLMLYKSKFGYELRLVGKNGIFAAYGGISTGRITVLSVMISGALAGLAGIVEILGMHGTFKDNFSVGLGFDGIIISLLARNHPIGVLAAAFLYAYIQVGSQAMQLNSDVPRELAVIIQVLLVLFVSSQAIFNYLRQRRLLKSQKAVNAHG